MAAGHSRGGGFRTASNHPALAAPREGFSSLHPLLIQGGDFSQRTVYLCRSLYRSTDPVSVVDDDLMPTKRSFGIRHRIS